MGSAAKPHRGRGAPLSPDSIRQLETLGYVGGAGSGAAGSGADLKREDPKDFAPLVERLKAATTLRQQGRFAEAEKELLDVVAQRPKCAVARYWLAQVAMHQEQGGEAARQLRAALAILAESKEPAATSAAEVERNLAAQCHVLLGRVLFVQRKFDQAIAEYHAGMRIDPAVFGDNDYLITALAFRGRFAEAVAHCGKALNAAPGNQSIRNKLAWLLATCPDASVRDGARAVEIAGPLIEGAGSRSPVALETLAAAYAEAGQFPQAVAAAEKAVQIAGAAGQMALAVKIRSELALYRARRPCRETPRESPPGT
jgi:tetratricopeptide (TPR) repeat protein